jgi:hypothetical protein
LDAWRDGASWRDRLGWNWCPKYARRPDAASAAIHEEIEPVTGRVLDAVQPFPAVGGAHMTGYGHGLWARRGSAADHGTANLGR